MRGRFRKGAVLFVGIIRQTEGGLFYIIAKKTFMAQHRIISRSTLVGSSRKKIDTVAQRKEHELPNKNMPLLEKCAILWENSREARRNRARFKRYTYGDQWSDYIHYDGHYIKEENYIRQQGNIPLVNNVMRRLINNVTGLYLKGETEPVATARDRDEQKVGEMMSIALQCNWQLNKMPLLLANLVEDYAIGGMSFARVSPDVIDGVKDIFTTAPDPNYMFWSSGMTDPRFWDLDLIGQIHDLPFKEVCHKFSHSRKDHELLERIYRPLYNDYPVTENITSRHKEERMSFWTPTDDNMCRVYEVWSKELKERYRCFDPLEGKLYKIELEDLSDMVLKENKARIAEGKLAGIPEEEIPQIEYEHKEDYYWFFQYLAPDGTVLLEGETPFEHETHPYIMSLYPLINGEIHPLAEDYIDQQRYLNRLIMMDDFVRRSGAKGVTMVPRSAKPDDMSEEEFARQWSSYDGLIFYEPKPGVPQPQQFYSNSVSLNTAEMVQMQINMMEDISSVHNAMQGKQPYAGTSAALYSQQAANATAALSSFLLHFGNFVEGIAVKTAKCIQQYYNEKKTLNIAGKNYIGLKVYDPEKARDIEFDLSIREGASTPVHRMLANDMLMEFWRNGAITIEQLLENGDFPFADALLQSIGTAKEEAAKLQGAPDASGASPQIQIPDQTRSQIAASGNPENIQRAQSMLAA